MLTLSGELSRLRKHSAWPEAMDLGRDNPVLAGAAVAAQIAPEWGAAGVNLGALAALWWNSPQRVIWRVRPETAEQVRGTGMNFVPQEPPPVWGAGAIIIESQDGRAPLVEGVHALGCYHLAAQRGDKGLRYWLVALLDDGSLWVNSIPCDLGPSNTAIAREALAGELIDPLDPLSPTTTPSAEARASLLEIFQWVFAFSFYAAEPGPGWRPAFAGEGPPARAMGKKKKVRRVGGRPATLWTYRELIFQEEPGAAETPRDSLDTSRLMLAPTIVRAYWRRAGERVILVRPHRSHRWKRPGKLGAKVLV